MRLSLDWKNTMHGSAGLPFMRQGKVKMKTYFITFSGRLKNAIGITYEIKVNINAESKEEAILKLYEKYEHIFVYSIAE